MKADLVIETRGSTMLVRPRTISAKLFFAEHVGVPPDRHCDGGVLIYANEIDDLVAGAAMHDLRIVA